MKKNPKRSRSKRRVHYKRNRFLMSITVCVVVAMTGIGSISLYKQNREYIVMEEELNKQLAEEEDRSREIEEYKEYVTTDEYVEQVAREKLGLVYPDEIILVPES